MSNQLRAVVTAEVRQFTTAMNIVGLSAGSAATIAVGAFTAIAGAVIALDKASLNASKTYETLRLRLQLLAGDMRKGAAEFERLKEFAENSAFATDEVISAYVRLRAVTGQQFATDQIENIAFASKVAGENLVTMARRVGELVLRVKTGLTGGLLARSLRTFGTAFGEKATMELVQMAQNGTESAVIIERLTQALGRLGEEAKRAFAQSAEGLEKQNEGLRKAALAELGGRGMDHYKDTLRELNMILSNITQTDAFGDLREAVGLLNEAFKESIQSDEFKQTLLDIMFIAKTLVNTIAALIKIMNVLNKIPMPHEMLFRPDKFVRKSLNLAGLGDKATSDDLAILQGRGRQKTSKMLERVADNTGRSANTLDPEKTAGVQ